jgi:hypothetical protein
MKTIFKFIAILILISCKAQNIVPIYNINGVELPDDEAYLKDVDNDYNPYVGTWKWENGNNSLTIIFNKVDQYASSVGDYSDLLVGEYQYIENGIELVNSFPLFDPIGVPNIINYADAMRNNNIVSYSITTNDIGFPPCPECAPDTRFILLGLTDPTKPGLWGRIIMARFVENGVEKIRARIFNSFDETATEGYNLSIPENSIYTLIKQ